MSPYQPMAVAPLAHSIVKLTAEKIVLTVFTSFHTYLLLRYFSSEYEFIDDFDEACLMIYK
jgi:hypothetical protein